MNIDVDRLNELERTACGGHRIGRTFHMLVKAVWMADFTEGPIYMRFGDASHMWRCRNLMAEIADELEFEYVAKLHGVKLQINDTLYMFDCTGFGMNRHYGHGCRYTHEFVDHWHGPGWY